MHVVLRRVNPAVDIDLVQVGYIKDGQFSQVSIGVFADDPIFKYFTRSSVSSSPFVAHSSVSLLVADLSSYPNFGIEFFDNTLVLMFDFNLNSNEGETEEEGKGN